MATPSLTIERDRDWRRSSSTADGYDIHLLDDYANFDSRASPGFASQRKPPSAQHPPAASRAPDPTFTWRSSSTPKLLLVLAAIAPLPLLMYLVVQEALDIRHSGPIVDFVTANRATTQILVSVFAKLFAGINIYVLTGLMLFAYRIQLTRNFVSLSHLKCAGLIASQSWNWQLPLAMFSGCAAVLIILEIPNVLWNGSLTPVINIQEKNSFTLDIPAYSNESSAFWSHNSNHWDWDCSSVVTSKGVFGNCPAETLQSTLLTAAAQATANLNHSYVGTTMTGYSYIGRSYGVGSSVGIVDAALSETGSVLLNYNYTELGYRADTTCFRNDSSNWHLELAREGAVDNGIPYVYYAIGVFPNQIAGGGVDFFAVTALQNDSTLAVVGAKASEEQHVILLTAGDHYETLNATQCNIEYTPTLFTVSVDAVNKLIQVTTSNETAVSFDETGGLASTATYQVNIMGMISTSLYVSIVGEALMSNIRATSATLSSYEALSDSFDAILDRLLLFVAGSQLVVAQDSRPVPVTIVVRAVKLGGRPYIVAISTVSVVLLVAVCVEGIRTRGWRELPKFDFRDLRDVMVASAAADETFVGQVWLSGEGSGSLWSGEGIGGGKLGRKDASVRVGRRRVMSRGFGRDIVAWWPEFGQGYTSLVDT